MRKKSKTSQVKGIFETALAEANECQYCINCDHAYLRKEDGNGYCKFQIDDTPFRSGYLKPIHEFSTCDHWKKRD